MDNEPTLLTIVINDSNKIDRESMTYRRILSARLQYESEFGVRVLEGPLTTERISQLCSELTSKYVIFIQTGHQISTNYVKTMLDYLRKRTVYLAEPLVFSGAIPKTLASKKVDQSYFYARDTDIFGVAFNVRRMSDALEAISDIDRTGLYIGYRLYWSINTVKPLPTAISVGSDTKAAIGMQVDASARRLFPLIPTGSRELRLYLLRYVALFLRGLRASKSTAVSLNTLREISKTFKLIDLVSLVEPLQPFEAWWIRWLDNPSIGKCRYKQLSHKDAYLEFHEGRPETTGGIRLYSIDFNKDVVTIEKSYLDHELHPSGSLAGNYDFYSRPISPSSTIIFFDRPLQADDNAEYLYSHFTEHYTEFTNVYFALSPKSDDWNRLLRRGFKLIPMFSVEFYEKFLISDLVVSSQIYNIRFKGKSFANSRFVYLQHGVQLNNMTDWVLSKYFDVMVSTGKIEADYLGKIAPEETINSGLPRLQTLTRSNGAASHILFMPTWRFNLHQVSSEKFADSLYFKTIDSILTDRSILGYLEKTGKTLEVKLHPNVEKRASQFHFSEHVRISKLNYRDAIASAEMVFTDYSSAVIDAAFIGTPIAYYQWDVHDFFEDQPYESRLDYRTDGLGPVFDNHDGLVNHIVGEEYLDTVEAFSERKARFFEGVDVATINSKIIERMLSL